jgi:hypothetical protein
MQTGARLGVLAAELVRRMPDVIVAFSTMAARPAKEATGTIPIVAVAIAGPVADGLVASLARPGGNVAGTPSLALRVSTEVRCMSCIFCKIIARQLPSYIIAEDENTIVFVSLEGHPIVAPKEHIPDIFGSE